METGLGDTCLLACLPCLPGLSPVSPCLPPCLSPCLSPCLPSLPACIPARRCRTWKVSTTFEREFHGEHDGNLKSNIGSIPDNSLSPCLPACLHHGSSACLPVSHPSGRRCENATLTPYTSCVFCAVQSNHTIGIGGSRRQIERFDMPAINCLL